MESTAVLDAELRSADQILAGIGAANYSVDSAPDVLPLIDRLLDQYRAATSSWREDLRSRISSHRALLEYLFTYMEYAIAELRRTRDPVWVERTLAAMSLEDARPDQRDTYTRAAQLRAAAAEVGLALGPYAAQAAAQANPARTVGFVPTADLIRQVGERP